jgi:hypothetical protein
MDISTPTQVRGPLWGAKTWATLMPVSASSELIGYEKKE